MHRITGSQKPRESDSRGFCARRPRSIDGAPHTCASVQVSRKEDALNVERRHAGATRSEAAREYHSWRRPVHECGLDESTAASGVHFHVCKKL